MKCNFPFNVALSLAGRERVTLKETSSRPCLSLCLSAWRGRNHIVVFSECVCSLCLCCAACNSLSPRMVAHFAIEVAAVFPLVPDNDCLNRAHTVLSVYAGSIYSVYSFVYMLPVHWFISELHLLHCSAAFHANLLHKLCSSWVEKVPRNTKPHPPPPTTFVFSLLSIAWWCWRCSALSLAPALLCLVQSSSSYFVPLLFHSLSTRFH